jgi:EAL domain-containing protein (putative c-di-GMP-specific phosphodiesterase class I)/DNA-binding NarL/FixJ family response regulator
MKLADMRVLIVEDDEFQRRILATILESLGVTNILHANNGRQALNVIHASAATPIHIALCDLNMPEMDGMEFLRHLGEEQRDIAVILSSSMSEKLLSSVGRMTRMYGINLLGIIEKPVLLPKLKGILLKYAPSSSQPPLPALPEFTLDEILEGLMAGQFEPFFQPKVDMQSGRLIGAEALARWHHPAHGVISPQAFIPLLETTRNIDTLTFQMLQKSAQACRTLQERGHLLTIAVNLSLTSLDKPTLADTVAQIVRDAGVEPQYIVLEITESAAMTDEGKALENLARLCLNGFSLAIDDYGTGASNLQQLTRIAFNELKIDQSFVNGFAENRGLRIIVESSIDMAHKLLVKSVAEGVESQQDWDTLKAIGCDTVQGYFIAQPMDGQAFQAFAERHTHNPIVQSDMLPQQERKNGNTKILVVDDDDFTRRIVVRVLEEIGYADLTDTGSASSAIRLLETQPFDLIITDVNMPGVNGLQLIQLIRAGKTEARPETRIMILSSFSQTEILGTALALDINGFLVKPIIPAIVEEKLRQALAERLHLRPSIAYESVKTDVKSLPRFDVQNASSGVCRSPVPHKHSQAAGPNCSLSRLRPGMILKENAYLKDGTLILSAGHTLTELSINRLNDLKALLPANGVAVQETLL